MTMDTRASDAEDQEQLSSEVNEGQESSEQGVSSPPAQQPTPRERELERRLTTQGRELADTKRAANALAGRLDDLSTTISKLSENQTTQAREAAERREREMEAYLASLPADERLTKRVELLTNEVKTLRQERTAAQTARPATPAAQRAETTNQDPDVEYMRRAATTIVGRAQDRYGVTISRDDLAQLPEDAWDSEDNFHDAVYELARGKKSQAVSQDGDDVANKGKKEPAAAEDEDARIQRVVRQTMGIASPASPRAAAPKGKTPTEQDVRQTVSTYDSAKGPKANVAKLREQRARMGTG